MCVRSSFLGVFAGLSLLALSHSPAGAVEALELQVSRVGDLELSCGQLSREAELMRDIITTTEDIKDDTKMKSRGAAVAGAAASFLVGTVTGGVGVAAAGFLIDHQINEKAEDADSVQDIAEQRRTLMVGIYNAKGCSGPIDHVMQDNTHQPDDSLLDFDMAAVAPAAGGDGLLSDYNE